MKALAREIVERIPSLKRVRVPIRYNREIFARLTDRLDPAAHGAVFFTSQKCASTFIQNALQILADSRPGLWHLDFEGLYSHTRAGNIYQAIEKDAAQRFSSSNAQYGPIREFVRIPNLDQRPVVLTLRDPRDVLVSAYYSVAFSHTMPGEKQVRFLLPRKLQAAIRSGTNSAQVGDCNGHALAKGSLPMAAMSFDSMGWT